MPRVVACGSRQRAYDQFCAAIDEAETDSFIVILVDSETAVAARDKDSPWEHLEEDATTGPGPQPLQITVHNSWCSAWKHGSSRTGNP